MRKVRKGGAFLARAQKNSLWNTGPTDYSGRGKRLFNLTRRGTEKVSSGNMKKSY